METKRILTTHVGSLPRPQDLLDTYVSEEVHPDFEARLRTAVAEVIRQQADVGLDIVNDGEYGKPTQTNKPGYGHLTWALYIHDRLAGYELAEADPAKHPLTTSKDRVAFRSFYGGEVFPGTGRHAVKLWTCTSPVNYIGHAAVERDAANLQAGADGLGVEGLFLPVVSPQTVVAVLPNAYYETEQEYGWAIADAMKEEYEAIVGAGIDVQVDDPGLAVGWDTAEAQSYEEYRRSQAESVEMLNHALSGVPRERIRYHLCWGSWVAPHSTDLPLAEIVDLVLSIRAGAYSFEASNPRHEHEWRVWENVSLPEGAKIIPGVVTHKTAVLEHPELVAERLVRFADAVGRENVVAGTDCGMGGRIDPELAWAKLAALVEGARLASARLWGEDAEVR